MNAANLRKRRSLVIAAALSAAAMVLVMAGPALSGARRGKTVIRETMPAVAMIVAVKVENGAIKPVSSGSGTIIDHNGSIITNHHVLADAKTGVLHDLFIVGLFRAADRPPELICAGDPSKGMLKPEVDLALIRCDRDRSGVPWSPAAWPTLPIRQIEKDDIVPGEQVWVLGYPGVGGSTINVTAGLVSGWTGEEGGATSRAFMKTDASITHGNSGGTAIDEDGNFIGVPSAFRLTTTTEGKAIVAAGRVGLIRPLEHALDLIAQARRGGPGQAPKPVSKTNTHSSSLTLRTRIVDASDGKPVEGATLVVFRPGLGAGALSSGKLESQAQAWARSDAGGYINLNRGLSRGTTHTVAITAAGYLPVVEANALSIAAGAPTVIEPWPRLSLQPLRN